MPAGSAKFGVRFQTELLKDGKVVRVLQSGHNMITDWGMDAMATAGNTPSQLTGYLHLSSALGPVKRSGTGGITLTLTLTSATNIAAAASAGFFLSTDVGLTLWIDSFGQELKVVSYTDSTHVTCSTRQGAYLPGLTPGTGPFSTFSIQPTNTTTLAAQFTKFNSYDTSSTNYNACLNDSSNLRWNFQKIYLSPVVSGSAWTVNQAGWSDGNGSNNVFGWVNLASPDTVPVGFQYRLTLNVYYYQSPLNSSYNTAWGSPMGALTVNIQQKAICNPAGSHGYDSFSPWQTPGGSTYGAFHYTSGSFSPGIKWEGDSGFAGNPYSGSYSSDSKSSWVLSSYTAGAHTRNFTFTWSQLTALTNVVATVFSDSNFNNEVLTFVFTSANLTKPTGYTAYITLQMFWTRQLVS